MADSSARFLQSDVDDMECSAVTLCKKIFYYH